MSTAPLVAAGADVSHHQPPLDLPRAKRSGLKFIYHKATEGDTFTDPEYNLRREQAAKADIPFGAYHFARAELGDAVAEARRFIKVAAPQHGDLIPALDLETAEGLTFTQLKVWGQNFANEVERLIGVRPVLYSPWEFGLKMTRWVPRYNSTNTPPTIPWDIWQFSDGISGVPNEYPGLGHVDLNVFRSGFSLAKILIPAEAPRPEPEPEYANLRVAHVSMQFSDSGPQKREDAIAIFAKGYDMITGTEARPGEGKLAGHLDKQGRLAGYRVFNPVQSDGWIAVREDLITGDVEQGYIPVIPGSGAVGSTRTFGARGITWASFDAGRYGKISVSTAHYLTGGRDPGKVSQHGKANHYDLNVLLAKQIGAWASRHGRGQALAFYGGDQNMFDRNRDTFYKAPLTSIRDELEDFKGGRNDIDVVASFDGDQRVEGVKVRTLRDGALSLHTDHPLVVGTYRIRLV